MELNDKLDSTDIFKSPIEVKISPNVSKKLSASSDRSGAEDSRRMSDIL